MSSQLFNELREPCVELSRFAFLPQKIFDPDSRELLDALGRLDSLLSAQQPTSDSDTTSSLRLAEYVFFPVSHLLRQNSLGEPQTQFLLSIISHILRLWWHDGGTLSKELATQIFPILTYLINDSFNEQELKEKKSREFKRVASLTLYQFYASLSNQNSYKHSFFLSDGQPGNNKLLSAMAHSVTILLTLLLDSTNGDTRKDPELQLTILNALDLLYSDILNKDGEMLSLILPGNVSTFSKFLCAPGRGVYPRVVSETLRVMGGLLTAVYDDLSLGVVIEQGDIKLLTEQEQKQNLLTTPQPVVSTEYKAGNHRTTSWLRGTSQQVKRALQSFIPKLIKRDSHEINSALVEFLSTLLIHSGKSLYLCRDFLISTLLELGNDPISLLRDHSYHYSDDIRKVTIGNLHKLSTAVHVDDTSRVRSITFALRQSLMVKPDKDGLQGIVKLAISQLMGALTSEYYTSKGLNSGSLLLKRDPGIVERTSSVTSSTSAMELVRLQGNKTGTIVELRSSFVLRDLSRDMQQDLVELLYALGSAMVILGDSSGDIPDMISELLQPSVEVTDHVSSIAATTTTGTIPSLRRRVAAMWVASNLMRGAKTYISEDTHDELASWGTTPSQIDADILNVPTEILLEAAYAFIEELDMSTEGTNNMAKEYESGLCTALFAIETSCLVIGDDFKHELIDYLYPVIENLASSSPSVREFARGCTQTLANQLYGGDVKTLIVDNVDYLVDAVSNKLNLGMTERVGTVLTVICKMVGYEAVLSFRDVLETLFKLLDYYHGYSDLCLQFFQLFKVLVNEMKVTYMKSQKVHLLGNEHLARSTYAPWGMTNIEQVINVLDKVADETELLLGDQSDYPLEEGEPKNFQEYFERKLKEVEVDSDDEEGEGDGIQGTLGNDREKEGTKKEKEEEEDDAEKWVSPIPRASYRLLLQILSYGERLLKHNSKPLKVEILGVIKLLVEPLATQYSSLLPQVAQIWDALVECCLDTDYSIVIPACECIQEVIHYSGDFVAKRFLDLWGTLSEKVQLVKDTLGDGDTNLLPTSRSNKVVVSMNTIKSLPPLKRNTLVALSKMLLEGISVSETLLPEVTLMKMLRCCAVVIPYGQLESRSLLLGDVCWKLKEADQLSS